MPANTFETFIQGFEQVLDDRRKLKALVLEQAKTIADKDQTIADLSQELAAALADDKADKGSIKDALEAKAAAESVAADSQAKLQALQDEVNAKEAEDAGLIDKLTQDLQSALSEGSATVPVTVPGAPGVTTTVDSSVQPTQGTPESIDPSAQPVAGVPTAPVPSPDAVPPSVEPENVTVDSGIPSNEVTPLVDPNTDFSNATVNPIEPAQ